MQSQGISLDSLDPRKIAWKTISLLISPKLLCLYTSSAWQPPLTTSRESWTHTFLVVFCYYTFWIVLDRMEEKNASFFYQKLWSLNPSPPPCGIPRTTTWLTSPLRFYWIFFSEFDRFASNLVSESRVISF